jgi:hypothetical protein
MPIDPEEFARMLGAEVVGKVPDVGGGPFGMARLARILHQRLTPSRGERPGRPTDPVWEVRPKVPMSEATLRTLTRLAREMSTAGRQVSPMQVAAQLLEEALRRVGGEAQTHSAEVPGSPTSTASSPGVKEGDPKSGEAGQQATTGPDRDRARKGHTNRAAYRAGKRNGSSPPEPKRDPEHAKSRRRKG